MSMNFVLGMLMIAAGFAAIYWSYSLVEFFGRSEWAERNVGGTRNLLIFIGFALMVVGGLVMFGVVSMGTL